MIIEKDRQRFYLPDDLPCDKQGCSRPNRTHILNTALVHHHHLGQGYIQNNACVCNMIDSSDFFTAREKLPLNVLGKSLGEPVTAGYSEMITNPNTGATKESKLARFDLIPQFPLWSLAEHYGKGAKKYEDRNWEKGIEYKLCFAAMMRHASLWWSGEDVDAEGFHHLDAIPFHAFALREFQRTGVVLDSRPSKGNDNV